MESEVAAKREVLDNLEHRLRQSEENLRHEQEKKANLSYALDSQEKKNVKLRDKLASAQKKLYDEQRIHKLGRELFINFILLAQHQNIKILNKSNSIASSHKKIKDKELLQPAQN